MKTTEIEFAQVKNTFSMRCRVWAKIPAKPEAIWALLTDAKGFSRWNSTVTRIDGKIREGERIRIHVPGTDRTFTPKVSGIVTNQRMTWSDGIPYVFRGLRNFELRPCNDNSTEFVMEEKFDGVVFALVKGLLPDFKLIFENYARDLKQEAEKTTV
ncbi:MAG TPA: SRPBCC domain-containing protein [Cyclobacteriaceae bacterium]|jgi:hypothetical protein|nr:SRPBCC domain-containing protein [Cyclobacteriaceae bacterium]